MTWVLDSSAVICWLKGEPGKERVRDILSGNEPVLIHAVNLVEVHYHFLRHSQRALQTAIANIQATTIETVRDMDDELLSRAARLKAHHTPIALGDVFAAALAEQRGATLVTTDRAELQKVADAGICAVEFLR